MTFLVYADVSIRPFCIVRRRWTIHVSAWSCSAGQQQWTHRNRRFRRIRSAKGPCWCVCAVLQVNRERKAIEIKNSIKTMNKLGKIWRFNRKFPELTRFLSFAFKNVEKIFITVSHMGKTLMKWKPFCSIGYASCSKDVTFLEWNRL